MTSIAAPQLAPLEPLASSAPAAPVQLQLGQILSGTVIALLNDTMLRLQTPAGLLDVAADTPLPSGTPVAITVEGTAQQPRIVVTPVADGQRQPVPQQPEAANESSAGQIGSTGPNSTAVAAPAGPSAADVVELTHQQGAAAQATLSTATAPAASSSTQVTAPALTQTAVMQAALSTATAIVRDAATTQGSLAALYANLEAAVSTPSTPVPAPILDAARLVLAMRFNMTSSQSINADDVSAALMRSGLASAVPAAAASAPVAAATDLGTALIALRQVLKNWLDQQTDARTVSESPDAAAAQPSARINTPMQPYRGAVNVPQAPALTLLATATPTREQTTRVLLQAYQDTKTAQEPPNAAPPQVAVRSTAANIPMPPYRGSPSVPQAPAAPSLSPTDPPREQAIHLLSQTDAAIARQTLLRIVSLPGDPAGNTPHSNDNSTRVMFEIPVATTQGTGVAPMTIERDGGKADAPEGLMSWLVQDFPSTSRKSVRCMPASRSPANAQP